MAFGTMLGERRLRLIYGGGKVGLMGAVADATLAAGGEVVGVITETLVGKEVAHRGLTELHVVGSMHERKALMASRADAFVALPGGFGTLDEFCEILTWAQLGLHTKPCAMLNVADYYTPLLAFFDSALAAGFLSAEQRAMVRVATSAAAVLDPWLS